MPGHSRVAISRSLTEFLFTRDETRIGVGAGGLLITNQLLSGYFHS
jgi:hypothetical protein